MIVQSATETCSCGGTFTTSGDPAYVRGELERWRTGHRHEPAAATPEPAEEPELHAVTGTHHKADARAINLGRRGGRRYVGFQTQEN